ncbi:MAG: DUF374 domain-containing protein [Pseudomonadota bacterium]
MVTSLYKRVVRYPGIQNAMGRALAGYLSLVHRTVKRVPADLDQAAPWPDGSTKTPSKDSHSIDHIPPHLPAIFTFWHGEHFMVGPAVPPDWGMHVMISKSQDGGINAIAAERLGISAVRGAGTGTKIGKDKGGARAFLRFVQLLKSGKSVAMTADVPKLARRVSPGLIKLAYKTKRPIIPVAYATHPRMSLRSWDRASVALPFTRAALGTGTPIYITDADTPRAEERACLLVADRLNALEQHAYRTIGGTPAFAPEELAHLRESATQTLPVEESAHG